MQNQDFTLVTDYIYGLKALLYLQSMEEFAKEGWRGQSPPTPKHQLGKSIPKVADIIGKVIIVKLYINYVLVFISVDYL